MNNFLIPHAVSTTVEWCDSDSRARFNRNIRIRRYEWNGAPVEYTFNKYGYRSRLDEPPKTGSYYVAFGCSQTFGIGIPEHTRYSNLIEDETGIPVLNLGISGGSINACYLNMLHLLISDYNPPDAIILQVPHFHRYSFPIPDGGLHRALVEHNEVFDEKFLVNELAVVSKYYLNLIDVLIEKFNIKTIKFAFPLVNLDTDPLLGDIKKAKQVDYARDRLHAGTQTNKNISEWILTELKS
jgi:hypothetical protein